jgi:hypothetical protein
MPNSLTINPTCDICERPIEGAIQKACQTRPSNPRALCSVMWACESCAPQIGGHPDSYWERYAADNDLDYEG